MEMQPVVVRQLAGEHFLVPDLVVRDLGVGQRQRDGVVPRLLVRRRVHRHARRLLQEDRVHVPLLDGAADLRFRSPVHLDEVHAHHRGAPAQQLQVRHQERAAAVVQQPLDVRALLQAPEREPVRLQMVALVQVHRHEDLVRGRGPRAAEEPRGESDPRERAAERVGGPDHGRALVSFATRSRARSAASVSG